MCLKYPIFADTLAHPFRYDGHKTLAFSFSSLASGVSRMAAANAFCRDGDREKPGEIASDSPFCPCLLLCIVDCVSAFEPRRSLQREWREKLSFSPVYFSSPLSTFFSNVSHPEAIYLICFLMRQTKEIKNSPFLRLPTRGILFMKKRRCLLEFKKYKCIDMMIKNKKFLEICSFENRSRNSTEILTHGNTMIYAKLNTVLKFNSKFRDKSNFQHQIYNNQSNSRWNCYKVYEK